MYAIVDLASRSRCPATFRWDEPCVPFGQLSSFLSNGRSQGTSRDSLRCYFAAALLFMPATRSRSPALSQTNQPTRPTAATLSQKPESVHLPAFTHS